MDCQAVVGPAKAAGVAVSQAEVEELNERLFELRVEVQNLAEDTNISVASIKRKVMQRQLIDDHMQLIRPLSSARTHFNELNENKCVNDAMNAAMTLAMHSCACHMIRNDTVYLSNVGSIELIRRPCLRLKAT